MNAMKKEKLLSIFKQKRIEEIFPIVRDIDSCVTFRKTETMTSSNSSIYSTISIDLIYNNAYNSIDFSIGMLNDSAERKYILQLLNKFNYQNPLIKFWIDEDNAIMATGVYIANDANFDGNSFFKHFIDLYSLIKDDYLDEITPFTSSYNKVNKNS